MATLDDLQRRHDGLMEKFGGLCVMRAKIEQALNNGIPEVERSGLQRQLTVVIQDIESTQGRIQQFTVVF